MEREPSIHFCVDGGIVKNENVIFIRRVFLKNIHCVVNLSRNILVGKVPLLVCPRPEEYSSGLCPIRGVQPAVVSGDEVGDHK